MDYLATKRSQTESIVATAVLGLAALAIAYEAYGSESQIALAASVGALGGLAHEIAQSKGKLLFVRVADDGIYLGAIAGMLLGAIAGLLAAKAIVLGPSAATADAHHVKMQLIYDCFFGGLALKGILEAAGTNAPTNIPSGAQTVGTDLARLLPAAPHVAP